MSVPVIGEDDGGHPEVEIWLDDRMGWCLTVPEKMPDSALRIMCAYALTTYIDMIASMPDTPRKRQLDKAIPDLIKCKVTQVVTPRRRH